MQKVSNKRAFIIGFICIATYMVNYYLRNLLSVMTPMLLETGKYTETHIGDLSSTYMLLYAAGQLVNGILGDRLSPKKMVLIGIITASIATVAFPLTPNATIQFIYFAALGFGLSMVRGPLMKIISENTAPNQARTICVFFSVASFAGPLIASLFALINNWVWGYLVAGILAVVVAVIAYIGLNTLEHKGAITYRSSKGEGFGALLSVFKIERFAFYMVIACIVEIAGASVSFWIPTYLSNGLLFDKDTANFIFSGISACRSFMPIVALAIFRATKEQDIPMMRVSFALSATLFLCMLISPNRYVSILFLLLALMCMSCSSALLWSIYIPSLGKTGKVSSVNGILDCTGYIAAALANKLFANVMANVGWSTVFVLWASLGIIGILSTLFVKNKKSQ